MSNLHEISINASKKWDEIVKSFPNYDVFYLNSYAKAFQLQGDGEPILIYYENKTERAINVVMKRDIAKCEPFQGLLEKNRFFDLSSPYGYGGFLSNRPLTEQPIKEYEQHCINKGYISEFIRFKLFGDYKDFFGGTVESHSHNVVRSLKMTLEDIVKDFEHRARKSLNKAKKMGLTIEIDLHPNRIDDFLDIYYKTMERTNAEDNFYFKKDFFEVINQMKDNIAYFYVIYEGKIISTELVIYGSENCYSFLGGTDREYFKLNANTFLKYEIIKWAKQKGLSNFILGGGYGKDDGIFNYKKSFAPNSLVDFNIGKRIYDKDKYNYLISLRKEKDVDYNINTQYFPAYRG
jgi:Acetyltransferase (GNAT) domain